jgi:hypothetical protein
MALDQMNAVGAQKFSDTLLEDQRWSEAAAFLEGSPGRIALGLLRK